MEAGEARVWSQLLGPSSQAPLTPHVPFTLTPVPVLACPLFS